MSRSHTANATFTVASWDETPVADIDGETTDIHGVAYPKRGFSRADVGFTYTGDLEGTSTVAYLIAYRDGGAPVVGFERFEGTLAGQDGSFVLQHAGTQDPEGVHTRLTIVEGLGTGGLEGIRGEATVEIAGHPEDGYPITLEYDL